METTQLHDLPRPGERHGHSAFATLRGILRGERDDMWLAVLYSVIIGLLSLAVPLATQMLVNTVAFGTVLQPVVILTIMVLGALSFSAVLQAVRAWVVEVIQCRLFVRVGADLVKRLVRVNAEAFDRQHGPELVNRFLEVVTVQKSSSLLLIDGLSVLMQTILGMTLLALYHPWLLAFDVLLLFTIAVVLFGLGRGAVRTSIDESQAKYSVVAWVEELARHIITFKSGSGARYAVKRADALFSDYLTNRSRHFRILFRQHVGFLALQALATSTLLGFGSFLVIQRQLTLGQLVAAELVVALIVSAMAKFGKYLETYYDLLAATDKLGHLEDFPLQRRGGVDLEPRGKGLAICMRNVGYDYPGRPGTLRDLSWDIEAGRHIGLTGGSGHGKTTLLDLIYGLRNPTSGRLEFDGIDAREVNLASLQTVACLVRSSEIFHGTVEENLALGNPDVTLADMRRALAGVGLLDEISSMPDGIKTELSTGGRPLSAGQGTRLMIARALVTKPRLLILDESLDQLDDALERDLLLDVLFESRAPWAVIIATEDESLLRRCDQVFVLEHGKLNERESAKSCN